MCPSSRSVFTDLTLAKADVTIKTFPRRCSSFDMMIIWCMAQSVGVTGMLLKLLVNLRKPKKSTAEMHCMKYK